MLEARGIETHFIANRGRDQWCLQLISPEAKRTVIFYAHYGRPASRPGCVTTEPFETSDLDSLDRGWGKARLGFPIRLPGDTSPSETTGEFTRGPLRTTNRRLWPCLPRSMRSGPRKIPLAVNLKIIFEGEEEAGSTNLQRTLNFTKNLLGADFAHHRGWPGCHQSGAAFGFLWKPRGHRHRRHGCTGRCARCIADIMGNWAPNPAMELSRLLASMKDADGRVLIEGYYDDVVPLGDVEKKASRKCPVNDADLRRELGIAKPEGGGKKQWNS